MTATTTPRDIRSPINGGSAKVDSPAVSPRARARVAATQSDGNRETRGTKPITRAGGRVASWWAWTAQPVSWADMWKQSSIEPARIPAGNRLLRGLWLVSNYTDRLAMAGLLLATPAAAQGPLRWCIARPTRRYGLYLAVAAFTATYLIGRN